MGPQDKRHNQNMLEKELGIHIKLKKNCVSHILMAKHTWLSFGTREKASEPGELISADVCGQFESFQKKRQAVDALMYLMVGTRSDLAHSVGFLSRSLKNPSADDIFGVRAFHYIAG
ncbi:hypothetical protein TNIN_452111 [Trichonephila inaurata madagascariensis]|uniref:Uncharacterized protein n=1 Tax=Trichonephila inaurata madagascariensis TaxID=2747483 RepID=A0A8X7BU88_9ARAC|nr:hypothetical protein TNIN_452111 [Trichonephila inaurata madagascariensis]